MSHVEKPGHALVATPGEGEVTSVLLADSLRVFQQANVSSLSTRELIGGLSVIEGRPWTGWSSEGPDFGGNAQELARLLRPLHIRSGTIGGPKAYQLRQHQMQFWLVVIWRT